MEDWWHRNITEPGKLPLLLALAAFLAAFFVARVITRLIRAGRGPFHDVSAGATHVHHVVPGIVLATVGGFGMATVSGQGWAEALSAAVFGTGTGLVMDEFALVLHLHDVYWSEQGRVSVEAVVLTAAVVGMVLLGAVPFGVEDVGPEEHAGRTMVAATIAVNFLFCVVAFAKGKVPPGVLGVVLPPVAWVAAVRLARPGSPWARRRYPEGSRKARGAVERAARHDARWGRVGRLAENLLGGKPDGE
ncbi:hypothetical protein [Streptomyces sp. GC420]|uniref:hypothetical protein n=1 Tax=Streptomyces sp. GC420 TaxID=2697568 RepID=UPI0014152319|nr:hypothetical protein [Streptomyces sp. GC420]NBM19392.1 hypothetical protein [Streptomyces sp. GC420]